MKEDIFRQEAALAELEQEDSLSAEKPSEVPVIPLPTFCHHSTGTVYDEPVGILRTAQLFEERGQMLDRKNLSLLSSSRRASPPRQYKTRRVSDVSPTRSRRNRRNLRPTQPDADGLFRDEIKALESRGGWAVSGLEVRTSGDVDETNQEMLKSLAVSSEQLNPVAVPCPISPTLTPSSNGLVKILGAADDEKHSDYQPSEAHVSKSSSIENMPLADATQRSENTMIPPLTAMAESQVTPGVDDIGKTDEVCEVIASHYDKVVLASRENKSRKTGAGDSENVESVMGRASRSADRRGRDAVRIDQLEESPRFSQKDVDTKPRQTRCRVSKEQFDADKVNDVTEELSPSLSQKSGVPRSARRTRSSVRDDSDVQTELPVASESADVPREQPSSASKSASDPAEQPIASKSPDVVTVASKSLVDSRRATGRPRRCNKIPTEVTPVASNTDSALQQELAEDELHKATLSREQEVLLQDLYASNQNSVKDSTSPQIVGSNLEAGDSTNSARLATEDSETGNKPYSHSYKFRLVEPNSSQSSDDQSRSVMHSDSTKYDGSQSQELMTAEPPHAGDAASMDDTRLVDSNDTSRLKPVNSPKHQESDTLLPKAPSSQSENVKKPTRNNLLPKISLSQSISHTLLPKSPSSESESVKKPTRNTLLPETPLSQSENVKKRKTPSSSRSRLSTQPGHHGEDARKEFSGTMEKNSAVIRNTMQELLDNMEENSAGKDGAKKKHASRSRRKINNVGVDAVSVMEHSESHVMKKTDDKTSLDKNASITLDSSEATTSQISTSTSTTHLPISVSSETSVISVCSSVVSVPSSSAISLSSESSAVASEAESGNHLESSDTLHNDDSLLDAPASSISNKRRLDVSDVDNLAVTGLKSAKTDRLTSSRNLAPNLSSLGDHVSATTGFHNVSTGTALPVNQGSKSGLYGVGSQLSDLAAKTSTASSRKRAAQLMAGCRPRTVGVKKPPPTIEDTVHDQPIPRAYDYYDRPPTSERLSFSQTHSATEQSVGSKPTFAEAPRHAFYKSQYSTSRCAANLTELGPIRAARCASRLNSSGSRDVGEEATTNKPVSQNLPTPAEDSLRKEENTREDAQLAIYDSVGNGLSRSLLSSAPAPRTLTAAPAAADASKDSRREAVRAELLRKFLPSQLIVSDAIKRKVQDGLKLLSTIRSAPTICSHTRQKLVDYLNQSRSEATQTNNERLPLRPIDEKCDDAADPTSRRRVPARPHRHHQVHSDWEFVSGGVSPSGDVKSNSDSDDSMDVEDSNVNKASQSLVRTQEGRIST